MADIEVARFDTAGAVLVRMKALDEAMKYLIDRVMTRPTAPLKWNLEHLGEEDEDEDDGNNSNTNNNNEEKKKKENNNGVDDLSPLAKVAREILSDFAGRLENSKNHLVSSNSGYLMSPNNFLMKQEQQQQEEPAKSGNKRQQQQNKNQPISMEELQDFLYSHESWKLIPRFSAQSFFSTFRTIMEEAGPVISASSFLQRNKALPRPLVNIKLNNQNNNNSNRPNALGVAAKPSVQPGFFSSVMDRKLEHEYKFKREGGIGSLLSSCCGGESTDETYSQAINEYNHDIIRSFFMPAEHYVQHEQAGANQSAPKPFSVSQAILARGKYVLNATRRGWLPADVVVPIAVKLLASFDQHLGSSTTAATVGDISQPFSSGEEGAGTSSSSSDSPFVKLAQQFERISSMTSSLSLQRNNNNSNEEGNLASAASGVFTSTTFDYETEQQLFEQAGEVNNIFADFESFTHILATGHFHSEAAIQKFYPKHLASAPLILFPKIKRLVWNCRKSVSSKLSVMWSNYATSLVDKLSEEAAASAIQVITGKEEETGVAIEKNKEPERPIKAKSDDAEVVLNSFLDGFVDRYKELVGAAVRLSKHGEVPPSLQTAAGDLLMSSSPSSPSPLLAPTSSSSATAAASGGGGGGGGNSNQQNNNNNKGLLLDEDHDNTKISRCCGFCTRGLYTALKRAIPETTDVTFCKILQSRLRQKLIGAFVSTENDKNVVRTLLSDLAEKVWHLSFGDELDEAEKKYLREQEEEKKRKKREQEEEGEEDAKFSPVGDENNNNNDSPDPSRPEQNSLSRSLLPSSVNATSAATAAAGGTTTATTASKNSNLSALERVSKILDRTRQRERGGLFSNEQALAQIDGTFDRAKNRVVWHASAVMTRTSDEICVFVAMERCPQALLQFNEKYVKGSAKYVQPHLLLQAQALLAGKELARLSEQLCELGLKLGGPLAGGINKNSAPVIEMTRVLDQMNSLLKKFPRDCLERNLEMDADSDIDDVASAAAAEHAAMGDEYDRFGGHQPSGYYQQQQDPTAETFAEFGRVLPLWRWKNSWNRYSQLVKNAA